MINIARNRPLAFTVGVAGFLGSHLSEELLAKNIQVLGVDDFSTGFRENLENSTKSKDFHLISKPMSELTQLEVERLDYAFFIISAENSFKFRQSFSNFLKICQSFKPRIVLVSSIELYDAKKGDVLNSELKYAEKQLAEYSAKEKGNARVVRLSAVFGPRMHFRDQDPLMRLIEAAALGEIQKESTPLDFSSRGIFVKDAVNLLIKAVMHGATSQKIYDGALLNPIKTAEIKQVLLDPLWHEEKGFTPTELPPWPTPNLVKTVKELSWKPSTSLVKALKETLKYFRENPEKVKSKVVIGRVEEKKEDSQENNNEESFWRAERHQNQVKKDPGQARMTARMWKIGEAKKFKNWFITCLCLIILMGAVIYPLTTISLAGVTSKQSLDLASKAFISGEYQESIKEVGKAKSSFGEICQVLEIGDLVTKVGVGKKQWGILKSFMDLGTESIEGVSYLTVGGQQLSEAMRIISGEKEGDAKAKLTEAITSLETADRKLERVQVKLNNPENLKQTEQNFSFLGRPLWNLIIQIKRPTKEYQQTATSLKVFATILSNMVDGNKRYLVIWQDNRSLRPGGGVINTALEVIIKDGKLSEIREEHLTDALANKIEAPAEVKVDLKKSWWEFKDIAYDLDFPEDGKLLAWYFNKQTGQQVDGVISIDTTAMVKLLDTLGPVETEKEGSPLLVANQPQTLKVNLNRIFFLPKKDWPNIVKVFSELKDQKHIMFYSSDPVLFNFLKSEGLTGSVPRTGGEFLAVAETNLKEDNLNENLKRELNLESKVKEDGGVEHKLAIRYSLPKGLGDYQSKVKVYLPQGNTIKPDKNFSSFSDYSKSGHAYYLTIKAGETKEVILQYSEPRMVNFKDNQAAYALSLFKQPGAENIPFTWQISYPNSWIISTNIGKVENGKLTVKTDFSTDQNLEITFKK